MKVKKRLFEIFGPVLCAALLMVVVFLSPIWIKFSYVSPTAQKNAAASLSPLVLKGQLLKRRAWPTNMYRFSVRPSGRDLIRFIHQYWPPSIIDHTGRFYLARGEASL